MTTAATISWQQLLGLPRPFSSLSSTLPARAMMALVILVLIVFMQIPSLVAADCPSGYHGTDCQVSSLGL
jgi:hypothetical protein